MNLRFLNTIVAISKYPTLFAAANSIGLSHSAVSVQVRALEDELNIQILDRSQRPPVLTDQGHALVKHAIRIQSITEDIHALAGGTQLHGSVTMGTVPSEITHLVAPALAHFNKQHPELKIELHTDLSTRLVQRVKERDIDTAIVTKPGEDSHSLSIDSIFDEPFMMITSETENISDFKELLNTRNFIWFDRRSWLSRYLETYLYSINIHPRSVMEVDSLEAVETLVSYDLGVSIVPRRVGVPDTPNVRYHNITGSTLQRSIALVTHAQSPRNQFAKQFAETLRMQATINNKQMK